MRDGTIGKILSERLIGFSRFLRFNNFLVGPEETVDMIRSLETVDLADGLEVRIRLQTILCSSKEEQERFDDLFSCFFRESEDNAQFTTAGKDEVGDDQDKAETDEKRGTETIHTNSAPENETIEIGAVPEFEGNVSEPVNDRSFLQAVRESSVESRQNQTIQISPDNIAGMTEAARQFIKQVRLNPSRRWQLMAKGRRLDVRRTIRRSLGTGGYPIDPVWTGHPRRDATFAMLCDGSRSMLPHAGVFLQFAYALINETRQADLFLFSTRLKRVTHLLKKGTLRSLPMLPGLGEEWGGGTKLGESLASFVRNEGARLLTRHTIVVIYSDGLDTGSIDQLTWAMKHLQYRSHTVIWLNPLAAQNGYEPEARGMKSALPYIDLFFEARDTASFARLAKMVARRGCH